MSKTTIIFSGRKSMLLPSQDWKSSRRHAKARIVQVPKMLVTQITYMTFFLASGSAFCIVPMHIFRGLVLTVLEVASE